jgi:hypothetical protein
MTGATDTIKCPTFFDGRISFQLAKEHGTKRKKR